MQYDESDLQFIQRLCEEEGIHYHFQHSASGHKLVFGDDQTVFRETRARGLPARLRHGRQRPGDQALRPAPGNPHQPHHPPRLRLRKTAPDPGKRRPRRRPAPDLEDYDYPGRFIDRERGKHLAKRALERHRSDFQLAEGKSDQPILVSGHFLALTQHPKAKWNDLWLLTEILHEGKQPQVLEESVTSDTTQT